jgi:hypothetical protein
VRCATPPPMPSQSIRANDTFFAPMNQGGIRALPTRLYVTDNKSAGGTSMTMPPKSCRFSAWHCPHSVRMQCHTCKLASQRYSAVVKL